MLSFHTIVIKRKLMVLISVLIYPLSFVYLLTERIFFDRRNLKSHRPHYMNVSPSVQSFTSLCNLDVIRVWYFDVPFILTTWKTLKYSICTCLFFCIGMEIEVITNRALITVQDGALWRHRITVLLLMCQIFQMVGLLSSPTPMILPTKV